MNDQKIKNAKTKTNKTKRPPKKITERYLTNSGLYYLKRYVASSEHFKTVMKRKIYKSCRAHPDQDPQECYKMLDKVTATFIEQGHLNDEQYTQGMVNSLRRSGKSAKAIEVRLSQKGVPKALIKHHLESYEEHRIDKRYSAEMESALTFARKKKIGPYTRPDKMPEADNESRAYEDELRALQQKQLAQMARAGYSFDTAKKIVYMKEDELD